MQEIRLLRHRGWQGNRAANMIQRACTLANGTKETSRTRNPNVPDPRRYSPKARNPKNTHRTRKPRTQTETRKLQPHRDPSNIAETRKKERPCPNNKIRRQLPSSIVSRPGPCAAAPVEPGACSPDRRFRRHSAGGPLGGFIIIIIIVIYYYY